MPGNPAKHFGPFHRLRVTQTMKRTLLLPLVLAGWIHADEMKTFSITADDWAEGEVPKEVFVVDGTIKIAAKDGNKAIMIDPTPITDATAQLGDSANGSASIEARAFASKKGRSQPRFGVSVHGMKGWRLFVNASKKQLELIKDDQVLKSAPYAWATDTWTHIKLEVKRTSDAEWAISGKAWPGDAAEPNEALIQHTDTGLKGQGKCAIWGTPFSEMPIYFDDVKVSITPVVAK